MCSQKNNYDIEILREDQVFDRIDAGLLVPTKSNQGLRLVDCGDRRAITSELQEQRLGAFGPDITPGRYFGGRDGLVVTALVAAAANVSPDFITTFTEQHGAEKLADLSADLANRAEKNFDKRGSLIIHGHSSTAAEGHKLDIDFTKPNHLGYDCAFAMHLGTVARIAAQEEIAKEALYISNEFALDLPIREVHESITLFAEKIPEEFKIHRGAMIHASHKVSRAPMAVLNDFEEPNGEVKIIYDLGAYRSDAGKNNAAGLPRYHHTINIASERLPELMPEFSLDEWTVAAASLLVGVATRHAIGKLKGHQVPVEVIAPDSSANGVAA